MTITLLKTQLTGSLFKFEDRVNALEEDFLKFKQTTLFAEAVSSLPGIVDKYLANQMNEAVKAEVQLKLDRLRDDVKVENEDFINKINESMKKMIKEQVKVQAKEQVSNILSRIKKFVNEQLEDEVLTHSSNESKTSHAVATNLSELELKKILIDKMESNKLIHRSVQDIITFKRRRDDDDVDEEPFAGSNRGSKRRRSKKELESTSAPKEKTSKSTGWSKKGSKSKTSFTEDHIVNGITQHPDWFQKPVKPTTLNRNWNKTLPAVHGRIQPWISTLARNKDPRASFNELMDTPLDFSVFGLNRINVDTLTLELLADPTFELMKGSCKLTNLNIKEHLALGVSLRMFTRSLVIQRRVENLQLGIESFQKKLNLTRPDTYRSNLKCKTPNTAYSIPKGFIYQNQEKKNRLMSIDKLYKFSDDALNDVRSALNDTLKKIQMKYVPQTIWREVDRERAGAMIQAID
nr:hypothetical protein [Tanacetum cinerariifolium]